MSLGITEVGHCIQVPELLRLIARGQPWSCLLRKVGDDIWTTYEPVAPHTDSTADGLVTYGLIIVNDPAVVLVHAGVDYWIPPGTLYKIDGRVEHSTGAVPTCQSGCGLFAALIWDMPPAWTLADFAAELAKDPRFAECAH